MRLRYILAAALGLTLLGLIGYRQNLVTAYAKTQAILDADQSGRDVTEQVAELKRYSAGHMHAAVEFTLVSAYSRAVTDAQAKADAATAQAAASNKDLYAEAQASCGKSRASSVAQSACVVNYVNSHQQNVQAPQPTVLPDLPSKAAYQHAIASPIWSFDFAGMCLGLGLVGFALSAITVVQNQQKKQRRRNSL